MPDIRSIAQDVKQRVSALEMGRRIGLAPDRHGYCMCPFHVEKTGSMRLYDGDKGWWCYGCHKGGSVIDLVMQYYGLSITQALLRIDAEMGLGLPMEDKTSPQDAERARQEAETLRQGREQQKKAYAAALDALLDAQADLMRTEQEIDDLLPRTVHDAMSDKLPALYKKRQQLQETISRLEMEVIRG